jgi:hypothetical protein
MSLMDDALKAYASGWAEFEGFNDESRHQFALSAALRSYALGYHRLAKSDKPDEQPILGDIFARYFEQELENLPWAKGRMGLAMGNALVMTLSDFGILRMLSDFNLKSANLK